MFFSQVRSSVRDRIRLTGLLAHIGEDHIFVSLDSAVKSFESTQKPRRKMKKTPAEGEARQLPKA